MEFVKHEAQLLTSQPELHWLQQRPLSALQSQ